jgi:hypothetical protein
MSICFRPDATEAWTGVHAFLDSRGRDERLLPSTPTLLLLVFSLTGPIFLTAEAIPADAQDFLNERCLLCHSGAKPQAEVQLDVREVDWQAKPSIALWERVYNALARREMPPRDAAQPSENEWQRMVKWLELQLVEHSAVGGTVPRSLNREEYQNTIRDLFDLPDFQLPDSFPADDSSHGFDNVGESLILSPPLMAEYLELATVVADAVLPPNRGSVVVESKYYPIGVAGLSTSEGGKLAGDRYRLVSSRNMASAAAWPARFEAAQSGVYRLTVEAATFQTDRMFYERRSAPLRLSIYARPNTEQVYAPFGDIREIAGFDVDPNRDAARTLTAEIELFKGEVFGLHWENGPAYSDPSKRDYSRTFLADRLKRDRLYYAAMLSYGGGPRGTTQEQLYDATVALMNSGKLDLTDPRLDSMPDVWGGGLSDAPHNWIKAFVHEELHRFGPAVDLTDVQIEGPLRLIEDNEVRAGKARKRRFLGERAAGATDFEHAEAVVRRFLPKAFRRPANDELVAGYTKLAMSGSSLEPGLHLAIRRALVSPNFLYRGIRPGLLDYFDLASRLSYFLTSAPPDQQLTTLAQNSDLSDPEILTRETERLLGSPAGRNFVKSFSGQWLGTRLLRDIMPDPRLLNFIDNDREAMVAETEMFFEEMIRENHPLEAFIDPGFSYRNERLNKIYGGKLTGPQMRRVEFERGGHHGGILGLASVMMATANGVDTHPVERGVWLLENVFGMPPPEPPANIPAIAPDTSGATTLRDQLNRHRSDASCASCHKRIDPLGMVMENFDPVGRWRDNYPRYIKPPDGAEALSEEFYSSMGRGVAVGPPVDAVGTMPDGTRLEDVTHLKRYVIANIDMFSRCLTEKLLVYSTGRPLTFGDRRVVDRIVADAKANGNGFRDLIVAAVQSESFRTK